ncbi:MAG TPA: TatD family hydrolase [Acidimicrobiales bacterium]|jgi:TatD DNase family protein|nr:TatD family hydrolase [Acidimicrobiales bacterium]
MPWFDSHCHVPYEGLDDVDATIAAAREAGVARMITVGTDAQQSERAVETARRFDGVWATVGLHPHEAKNGVDSILPALGDGLRDGTCVAIGECGLDYYYDHSPRDVQQDAFARQIALAHEHGLALVIHTRDAWVDTWDILEAERVPPRTVFHCFTGGPDEARRCLDLGAFLSFSGIVTFKKSDELREAARICPLERLVVETDSPYLAPQPHRGKTNTPALVPLVGETIAAVHGRSIDEVELATFANACSLFGLPN